jgi:hypothetical protein
MIRANACTFNFTNSEILFGFALRGYLIILRIIIKIYLNIVEEVEQPNSSVRPDTSSALSIIKDQKPRTGK